MPWSQQFELPNPPFKPKSLLLTRETVMFGDRVVPLHEVTAVSTIRVGTAGSSSFTVILGTATDDKAIFIAFRQSEGLTARENAEVAQATQTLLELVDQTVSPRIVASALTAPLPQRWGSYELDETGITSRILFTETHIPWPRVIQAEESILGWTIRHLGDDGDMETTGMISSTRPNARYFEQIIAEFKRRFCRAAEA